MRSPLVTQSSGKRTLSSFERVTARPSTLISPISEAVAHVSTGDHRGSQHGNTCAHQEEWQREDRTEVDGVDPVEEEHNANEDVEDAGTEGRARHHRRTSLLVSTTRPTPTESLSSMRR